MFSETPQFDEKQASARMHISGSDPFALGHYPDDAIYPGVLSLHCMKSLCDQYIQHLADKPPKETTLKRITYIGIVRPGDVLNIICLLKKMNDNEVQLQAAIEVDGETTSKSSFVYRF